jgi:hypothetical protein
LADLKIKASDIKALADDGDIQGSIEKLLDDVLQPAIENLKPGENDVTLGALIIENDLEDEEDEDEESSED